MDKFTNTRLIMKENITFHNICSIQAGKPVGVRDFCVSTIPNRVLRPVCTTSLPTIMLRQVKLGLLPMLASMKVEFLKYLLLITRLTREHGSATSLHPCLLSNAKLKACRSLKSIPLRDFGLVIRCQLSQCNLEFPSQLPHLNFVHKEVRWLQSEIGSKKQLMEKVGIA